MSDYPMLISNKLHSFRNFQLQIYYKIKHVILPKKEKTPITIVIRVFFLIK
jgi:hypothetical protein